MVDVDTPIERWNYADQFQLCYEAFQWMCFKGDKVEGLCFKTDQHSVQKGIKKFGHKVKASEMKEMRNLAVKKYSFG